MNVKGKKNAVSPVKCISGLAVLFLLLLSVRRDMQASETSFGDVLKQGIAQELGDAITQKLVPVFSFVQQKEQGENWLLEQPLIGLLPVYGYSREQQEQDEAKEVEQSNEGKQENYLSLEEIQLADAQDEDVDLNETEVSKQQNEMQELLMAENEAALNIATENNASTSAFVPHELQNPVDIQVLSSYETLVNNFYTIDGNTMAGSDQLDVTKLLSKDLKISKESEDPQILIYHTHSQEGFSDSVPGDVNTTIVGVGAHLSDILQNQYGYQVLHHTGQYDVETRDDAYSNSLPAIEQVLAENPTIEVIIDLHRDSMPEETKLVMDLDGRPTARFMFFNGLSRTKNTGDIAYLHNENLEDNLAFSFQMQLAATEYYPGLTRKIYLKGYRYNMHLRPRTTLVELGAQNNTVEEAMNACDPLAHIIDMVLSGETRQ